MDRIVLSNSRKMMIILLVVVVVACGLLVGIKIYNNQRRHFVFTQDDKVFFNMEKKELVKIKGEPYRIEVHPDTPSDDYYYKETIEGYSAETCYSFYRQSDGLNSVSVNIKVSNTDEARDLFYQLYNRMNEYYKTQKYYYCNDVEEVSPDDYSVSFGIDYGATGIRIRMSYFDGVIQIYSNYVR